jgi:hypothetical protein
VPTAGLLAVRTLCVAPENLLKTIHQSNVTAGRSDWSVFCVRTLCVAPENLFTNNPSIKYNSRPIRLERVLQVCGDGLERVLAVGGMSRGLFEKVQILEELLPPLLLLQGGLVRLLLQRLLVQQLVKLILQKTIFTGH